MSPFCFYIFHTPLFFNSYLIFHSPLKYDKYRGYADLDKVQRPFNYNAQRILSAVDFIHYNFKVP